uniref:Sidoreflexin n=1 Tax=Albugo laibachii Nc14 TaxID=890382 RepID=F0WBI9_9STRA|nr:sideroflexin1like protein putative [Albugo laibachii Nc14]|eukprot:CCA18516.1 sideroflexin1like protein putative [Albugo laibachii Nc14]
MTTVRVNIDEPRWDQRTILGRAKHFFAITNPLNVLATDEQLQAAKTLVDQYRQHQTPDDISEDALWKAKHLVESAYHPDTGEKNFLIGRMSFQVPGNMIITGCMMTFYRSTPSVIFWQFMNQTFNSVVNYTNRNASIGVTTPQLAQAFVAASTASVITAIGLNKLIAKSPQLSRGFVGRLVPLVAVAAANCVNIPLMRQREVVEGINVELDTGETIGKSKIAAKKALAQVIPSRILMAAPSMLLPALAMTRLERRPLLTRHPMLKAPITVAMTGLCLVFSTPICCALFPQRSSLPVESLESSLQEIVRDHASTHVCYNKGL